MFSSIKAMILILQRIWIPYHVNTRMNTTKIWINKLKVL